MNQWNDFYVAVAGAAAALTGLIFVGISINLQKILSNAVLPLRASVPIILLCSALTCAVLLLVPRETTSFLGYQLIVAGIIIYITVTKADIKIYRKSPQPYKRLSAVYFVIDQLATLPYIVAGIIVLINGESGLYWLVPAIILSFIKSILDAWVLLIEIIR